MATQSLTSSTVALRMPTGDGKCEVVNLSTADFDPALLIANHQSSIGAAGYEYITHRMRAWAGWNPRRIFVTSPTARDGKTCTAFNLAWTLGKGGASVLVVELNFMRPGFRNALGGLQVRFGIDCALRGLANRQDSVFSLGSELLGVSAVKSPMSRGELKQYLPGLMSYLNWAGDKYDWLVLDCPPALSHAWNSWFQDNARPALLVVREQHTPAIQVRHAVSRLRYRIKGVLLNDSSSPHVQNE